MARKTRSKHYPVQRNIGLSATSPAAANLVVDGPKNLSQTNHRLYRQSRYYEMSVTLDTDLAEGTTVDVYALADSWMVQKAYQMAKDAFDESNAEEMKMLSGRVARWNDFRVAHGLVPTGGIDTALATNYLKRTLAATPFTVGEFQLSNVVDQAGTTRDFSWGGADPTTYSIIEEYDASGNTNVDPTQPATGPYNGLLPNLEAGAAEALQADGNNPPYDANDIGQALWIKVGTLHLGAGRQRSTTGFFTAPCGFVALMGAGTIIADNATNMSVEFKRGDYKGVHAPSMLE
ncbi:MAG: putative capsid protein [Cressdnaviricota sp.]|nr:MAG: putative capsid protein [Cressdnaviricota sp.]